MKIVHVKFQNLMYKCNLSLKILTHWNTTMLKLFSLIRKANLLNSIIEYPVSPASLA